jgi:hypothetical protein
LSAQDVPQGHEARVLAVAFAGMNASLDHEDRHFARIGFEASKASIGRPSAERPYSIHRTASGHSLANASHRRLTSSVRPVLAKVRLAQQSVVSRGLSWAAILRGRGVVSGADTLQFKVLQRNSHVRD